jgi:hypothetical protein
MSNDIQEKVRLEIEELHEFFVGWFNGSLPESAFETGFLDRFSEKLVYIPPGGRRLGLDDLAQAIRDGYASNPDFRIAIREVQVHWAFDDYVMATYEEWQRNALASTPPDNGRVATVLFKGPEPLKWLHIHETWMPPEIMSAGPYDF